MKNPEFEKYLSEIPAELQEKARQCKSMKELNELIAENDLEISEEALEMVAGGACNNNDPCPADGGVHDLTMIEWFVIKSEFSGNKPLYNGLGVVDMAILKCKKCNRESYNFQVGEESKKVYVTAEEYNSFKAAHVSKYNKIK